MIIKIFMMTVTMIFSTMIIKKASIIVVIIRSYEKIREIETRAITLKGRTVTEVKTTSNIKLNMNVNTNITFKIEFSF